MQALSLRASILQFWQAQDAEGATTTSKHGAEIKIGSGMDECTQGKDCAVRKPSEASAECHLSQAGAESETTAGKDSQNKPDSLQAEDPDAVLAATKDSARAPVTPLSTKRIRVKDNGHSFTWQRTQKAYHPSGARGLGCRGFSSSLGLAAEAPDLRDRSRSGHRQLARPQVLARTGDSFADVNTKAQSRGTLGLWDQRPEDAKNVIHLSSMVSSAPGGPLRPYADRRAREAYVGNLPTGFVSAALVQETFKGLFEALPEFLQEYPTPPSIVLNVNFPGGNGNTFGFVEFFDEVIASTAVCMSGFQLYGKKVSVGRSANYHSNSFGRPEALPLDVSPLRRLGMIPPLPLPRAVIRWNDPHAMSCELYFGNLSEKVTDEVIIEFLMPICKSMPVYDEEKGAPITKIAMAPSGSHCLVQFQNEEMVNHLLSSLDHAKLLGRKLKVRRPSAFGEQAEAPAAKDERPPPAQLSQGIFV